MILRWQSSRLLKVLDLDADYMLDPDYMDLTSLRVIGADVRAIAESPKSKDLERQHSVLSTHHSAIARQNVFDSTVGNQPYQRHRYEDHLRDHRR